MIVRWCFCIEPLYWSDLGSAINLCACQGDGKLRECVPGQGLGPPEGSVLIRMCTCLGSQFWPGLGLFGVIILVWLEDFLGFL